ETGRRMGDIVQYGPLARSELDSSPFKGLVLTWRTDRPLGTAVEVEGFANGQFTRQKVGTAYAWQIPNMTSASGYLIRARSGEDIDLQKYQIESQGGSSSEFRREHLNEFGASAPIVLDAGYDYIANETGCELIRK
ncbi:MAG: hypothetical protein AABZ39_05745, partial [Spirochaetota bacterium]